jgi:hypothetical protein
MKSKKFDLGTTHMTATLSYLPPLPAPNSGANWSDFEDYPGVLAVVRTAGTELHPALRGEHTIGGCNACACWAFPGAPGGNHRMTEEGFRAPTLASAEAQARGWLIGVKAEISAILAKRELRLAKRAATIAAAHAAHGEITDTDEE